MYWLSIELRKGVKAELWFSTWSEVAELLSIVNGEDIQPVPVLPEGKQPDSIETMVNGVKFRAVWVDSRIGEWERFSKLED